MIAEPINKPTWIAYAAGAVIPCRDREDARRTADERMIQTGRYWAIGPAVRTAEGWLLTTPRMKGRGNDDC